MDRLNPARFEQAIGAGPWREGCLRAVRAFTAGAQGGYEALVGLDRAFALEGLGFVRRLRGESAPVFQGWEATFVAVGAGIAHAAGAPGEARGDEEREGLGFGLGLLRQGAWRLRLDDPALTHGLGRALWFREGGELVAIGRQLRAFTPQALPELARGLGFAAAFSCGLEAIPPEGASLLAIREPFALGIEEGAAFRRLVQAAT